MQFSSATSSDRATSDKSDEIDSEDSSLPTIKITEYNSQKGSFYQTNKGFIESLQNIIYQLLLIMHFTQAEETSTDHQSNQAPEYLINGSINDSD